MTFWVYSAADGKPWPEVRAFAPPAPPPVAGEGYPMFHVELDHVVFQFASLRELRVCIEVLSRRVLPTTAQLIRQSGRREFSNQVWLGRLPKRTHRLRYREKAVPYLREALADFEHHVPNQRHDA
jgi:hypothetical protein